ncbi:MAG: zf-HC2 domain-containing protein [Methylomonas sp.]|jgi:predicted anti-sigma-YlaC factor YlaD
MPNCREISALVSKGLDKKLSLPEQFAVRAHLLICSGCRNFKKQSLFIRELGHAYLERLREQPGKIPD